MTLENPSISTVSKPQQIKLKAGELDLVYENGSIRRIIFDNGEVLRMIYSAVRDRNWGTIEPVIIQEEVQSDDTSFDIRLKVEYKADPIHFIADYRITGSDNRIRFEMNGVAQADFLKNRIGFCILHPIRENQRMAAQVIHPDGSESQFIFPKLVAAHQPVKNVRSIKLPVALATVTLTLSGDVFEMEDQRNWTDASYKTYCTPLDQPFPVMIKKGETVSQVVELSVETKNGLRFNQKDEYALFMDGADLRPIPEIGTCISSREQTLTSKEIDLLKRLPLKHLRVEINMAEPDILAIIGKAIQESEKLGWSLFVVLYLPENYKEEYRQFSIMCKELNAPMGWLLPVGQNHLPLPAFDEIYPQIKQDFPDTMVGTGVNAYFAELNRLRPSIEKADFVSFTICPQVHAFDTTTLVENLEAQYYVVSSARKLFPGKPIFISPVSLKQRFNVVATSTESETAPGQLPSSVDPRQRSVFAAAWTLASLNSLVQAGAQLITYYETVGWKGLIQGEQRPELQDLFPAEANEIFPIYEFLKKLKGYSHIIHSGPSHPLQFDGLMVCSEEKIKLFLFNFTSEDIVIRLDQDLFENKMPSGTTFIDYSNEKVKVKANDWLEIEW